MMNTKEDMPKSVLGRRITDANLEIQRAALKDIRFGKEIPGVGNGSLECKSVDVDEEFPKMSVLIRKALMAAVGIISGEALPIPTLVGASYDTGQEKIVSAQGLTPIGVWLTPDGMNMFTSENTNTAMFRYELTTPWDVTTAEYSGNTKSLSGDGLAGLNGCAFSADGTVFIAQSSGTDEVFKYVMSTAWDLTSASYAGKLYNGGQTTGDNALTISPDGKRLVVNVYNAEKTYDYTMATAWDIPNASYVGSFGGPFPPANFTGMCFNADGTKFFYASIGDDAIHEYNLSIPFDTTSANLTEVAYLATTSADPRQIFINADQTKLFVVESGRKIHRYSLGAE